MRGRPRCRPNVVVGDSGYDPDERRRLVWALVVKPVIAHRGAERGTGLGTQRCVVERVFAHLRWFCRPRIRWGVRDNIQAGAVASGPGPLAPRHQG